MIPLDHTALRQSLEVSFRFEPQIQQICPSIISSLEKKTVQMDLYIKHDSIPLRQISLASLSKYLKSKGMKRERIL